MNKDLSLSEKLHNAMFSQQAENTMARHCYMHAGGFGSEEVDLIWSKHEEITWAHSFGRMRGHEHVRDNWAGSLEEKARANFEKLKQAFPEVSGMDARPLMEYALHTLTSSIAEVADDGKTARISWYTPGVIFSYLNVPGPMNPTGDREGAWIWERYGCDFVWEDGECKLLHMQVAPDYMGPMDGLNGAARTYESLINPQPMPEFDMALPPVDDPGPLNYEYSPVRAVQNPLPWPEPYVSMDKLNSY